MAGRIPQAFIDELITRADIVELIGSRVQLKKAGREFKACCPFHGEKTPSFTVSQTKQFYHCFGCGAHGTALGFLMDYDKLGFIEAVEELASRVGLEVPREAGNDKREQPGDDLYEAMGHAAQFFCDTLKDDARALEYVNKRGLTSETAAQFRIGFAPDSWNALLRKLGDTEPSRRRLLAAGLIVDRQANSRDAEAGFYDRFRDRVMFPIRDARGRVIAFGGRIIDKGEPKYLNSPETAVFHKGKELYGLYEARQTRQSLQRLLIVEGYMDVVRLHQAGITYALATLGTATTADHLTRIFRLTSEVVFCFDGDRAGRAAAWRALENALPQAREGRQMKFLFLPEGHDPDSLVGEEGREKFEARLASAVPLSEYLVEHLSSQLDLEHVDGRARLAELAKPLLQRIPAGVYRELLTERVAQSVRMPASRLAALLLNEKASRAEHDSRGQRPLSAMAAPPISVGSGSPVRQAVSLIVTFPEVALKMKGVERLEGLEQNGVAFLSELITDLRERPVANPGVLIERWRGRPEHEWLSKLAMVPCIEKDATAASTVVQAVIDTIVDNERLGRINTLMGRDFASLTAAEKLELKELSRAGRNAEPVPPKT